MNTEQAGRRRVRQPRADGLSTIVAVSWTLHTFAVHSIWSIAAASNRHHHRHNGKSIFTMRSLARSRKRILIFFLCFVLFFLRARALVHSFARLFRWAHLNRSLGCRFLLPIYLHWCACTLFIWHQSSHSSSVPLHAIFALECVASVAHSRERALISAKSKAAKLRDRPMHTLRSSERERER